jgi:hypothetical protein
MVPENQPFGVSERPTSLLKQMVISSKNIIYLEATTYLNLWHDAHFNRNSLYRELIIVLNGV